MRWILFASFAVAAFCAAYPMYVIRPFRTQGPDELALALFVMQVRPWVTALCVVAAIVAVWRAPGRRLWMGLGAAVVCLLAAASRVNVFELMFHPAEQPAFASAKEIQLDDDEKVLAIRLGNGSRAYPVRSLAYHHIVNDTIDSRAIVATY